jgi:hypothetical protein
VATRFQTRRAVALSLVLCILVLGLLLAFSLLVAPTFAHAAPLAFDCSTVDEIPLSECQALVAVYNSTNGPGWRRNGNWFIGDAVGQWYGVAIWNGHVWGLFLSGNELDGYLPAQLADLRQLYFIELQGNRLRGPIPLQLGFFPNLDRLNLNDNQFSGPLPQSLVNLDLKELTFDHTDVCEPANTDFQAWLHTIRRLRRTGVLCPAAAAAAPTPTPPCTAPAPSSPYSVRLNAGGGGYTDTSGAAWQADRIYADCTSPYWGATGGQVYTTIQSIAGTEDGALYQSERYFAGTAGYRFAVPNGRYQVDLHLAEIYPYTFAGDRVFSMRAEGQTVVSQLDVLASSGGFNRAYTVTVTLVVNDGELNLGFVRSAGRNAPFVNAIAVTQLAGVAPTATPTAAE